MAAFNAISSPKHKAAPAASDVNVPDLDRRQGAPATAVGAATSDGDDASALLWWSLGAWHKPHQHQQPVRRYGGVTSSTRRTKHHHLQQRPLQPQQTEHLNIGDGRRATGGSYVVHGLPSTGLDGASVTGSQNSIATGTTNSPTKDITRSLGQKPSVNGDAAAKRRYVESTTTYVTVVEQIKELFQTARADSDNCWTLLRRAFAIFANTLFASFVLGLLLILPFGMVSIGFKYLNECPIQPKIPIYLLVGGCFGLLKLFSLLFYQIRTRRYERLDELNEDVYDDDDVTSGLRGSGHVTNLSSSRFTDVLLSCFLFVWFVCGNWWVFSVWLPNYRQTIQQPTAWCNKTAYVFAVVQILVCYILMALIALLTAILIVCQKVYSSRTQLCYRHS